MESEHFLNEKLLCSLMSKGALVEVRYDYKRDSESSELSLKFYFNEKFYYASRNLYDENLELKTWLTKDQAVAYLRSINYLGEVMEDIIFFPQPKDSDDFLMKRAINTQDHCQFKKFESLAAELIFNEFADRFNAVSDIQEDLELRLEITEQIALLIQKSAAYWPNRKDK